MRVFLFAAGLVIMLFARLMHEIELVHEAAFFKQLERAVNGHAVQFRVALLGEVEEAFGIEVFAGFIDKVEEDFPLPRQPDSVFRFGGFGGRGEWAGIGHADNNQFSGCGVERRFSISGISLRTEKPVRLEQELPGVVDEDRCLCGRNGGIDFIVGLQTALEGIEQYAMKFRIDKPRLGEMLAE